MAATDEGGASRPRSIVGAVVAVGLAAAMLAVLHWAPGTTGVGTAEPAIPPLPAEGHAVYEVNVSGVEDPVTVRLNLTPEEVACRDGFGVQRNCTRGLFGADGLLFGRSQIAFSPDHAEIVTMGQWDPPSRSGQSFAGPYPSWEGYPLPFLEDGEPSWGLAERMVAVAVTAQARADVGTDRSTTFAGHPADLRGQPAEDGSALVTVEAALPEERSNSATFRYEATFDGSAAFPATITFRDLARPVTPLGKATLVEDSASTGTIDTEGWEPLPVPQRREGVDVRPWDQAPPSGDTPLFLPIDHADEVSQVTPGGLLERVGEEDRYVVEAFYSQELHHTDEPLRPTEIGAEWELTYADSDREGRETEVWRSALNDTRDVYTEGFREDRNRTPLLHDDYVPAREKLPEELVTVGDAVEIGRSAIPIPAHEVDVIWLAAGIPDQKATAKAGYYIVSCHRAAGFDVTATVSAVNGQLIARGSLFGAIECFPPP